MTDAVDRLLKEAIHLSDRERAEMAARLIESLDADAEADLDEVDAAWAAEIERRCDELDAGRAETIPWEQVRREIEASIRRR